jgi:hypothetical protein
MDIKKDSHGRFVKCKARLVARGFQQEEGRDFNENWIRILLSFAAVEDYEIHQRDIRRWVSFQITFHKVVFLISLWIMNNPIFHIDNKLSFRSFRLEHSTAPASVVSPTAIASLNLRSILSFWNTHRLRTIRWSRSQNKTLFRIHVQFIIHKLWRVVGFECSQFVP